MNTDRGILDAGCSILDAGWGIKVSGVRFRVSGGRCTVSLFFLTETQRHEEFYFFFASNQFLGSYRLSEG